MTQLPVLFDETARIADEVDGKVLRMFEAIFRPENDAVDEQVRSGTIRQQMQVGGSVKGDDAPGIRVEKGSSVVAAGKPDIDDGTRGEDAPLRQMQRTARHGSRHIDDERRSRCGARSYRGCERPHVEAFIDSSAVAKAQSQGSVVDTQRRLVTSHSRQRERSPGGSGDRSTVFGK